MSSRNMRLNEKERTNAAIIYQCLKLIKENAGNETPSALVDKAGLLLEEAGFKVDYIEIADAITLAAFNEPVAKGWAGKQKLVALVAAFMNEVRLIDNMLLN
jgi:pantoate--beta-alanine ligase